MLVVHDGWRMVRGWLGRLPLEGSVAGRTIARAITVLGVVLSMILFRADAVELARPYQIGANGLLDGVTAMVRASVLADWSSAAMLTLGGLAICFFLPTTQEILRMYSPTFYRVRPPGPNVPAPVIQWRPSYFWGLAMAATLAICVLRLNHVASFIYFKF